MVIGLDDQCIICYTKDTVKSSNNLSGYNTFKNLNLPVTVVTHKIQVASLNLNIFNINGPSPLLYFGSFVILITQEYKNLSYVRVG